MGVEARQVSKTLFPRLEAYLIKVDHAKARPIACYRFRYPLEMSYEKALGQPIGLCVLQLPPPGIAYPVEGGKPVMDQRRAITHADIEVNDLLYVYASAWDHPEAPPYFPHFPHWATLDEQGARKALSFDAPDPFVEPFGVNWGQPLFRGYVTEVHYAQEFRESTGSSFVTIYAGDGGKEWARDSIVYANVLTQQGHQVATIAEYFMRPEKPREAFLPFLRALADPKSKLNAVMAVTEEMVQQLKGFTGGARLGTNLTLTPQNLVSVHVPNLFMREDAAADFPSLLPYKDARLEQFKSYVNAVMPANGATLYETLYALVGAPVNQMWIDERGRLSVAYTANLARTPNPRLSVHWDGRRWREGARPGRPSLVSSPMIASEAGGPSVSPVSFSFQRNDAEVYTVVDVYTQFGQQAAPVWFRAVSENIQRYGRRHYTLTINHGLPSGLYIAQVLQDWLRMFMGPMPSASARVPLDPRFRLGDRVNALILRLQQDDEVVAQRDPARLFADANHLFTVTGVRHVFRAGSEASTNLTLSWGHRYSPKAGAWLPDNLAPEALILSPVSRRVIERALSRSVADLAASVELEQEKFAKKK